MVGNGTALAMQRLIHGCRKACFHKLKSVTDQARQIKKPTPVRDGLFHVGRLAVTYFRAGNPHYHRRRVVSPSCSGWEGVGPTRYGRQANCRAVSSYRRHRRIRVAGKQQQYWKKYFLGLDSWQHRPLKALSLVWQGYRIKPHGQLVSVSLTHYCASTPDLSTRWSSATL